MTESTLDFASAQIDRWERFGELLERSIARAEQVASKPGAHECGDPSCDGVTIDAETIEAMQQARALCLMEAEQWRARKRRNNDNTRPAFLVKS